MYFESVARFGYQAREFPPGVSCNSPIFRWQETEQTPEWLPWRKLLDSPDVGNEKPS